jgi:hypothetical protein
LHQRKIFLDRSYDGNLWLTNDIPVTNQIAGQTVNIPGAGMAISSPIMAVDRSKMTTRGGLYLAWLDQRSGDKGKGVWFMKSTNFGDIWTTPIKIHPENEIVADQFLPSMAVDQSSGIVYIAYYSKSADENVTDLYIAYSLNGGHSFKSTKVSESSFRMDPAVVIPYIHLSAVKGIIAPVWVQSENGKSTVCTAVINQEQLIKDIAENN